jgi:hypothetical protein
MKTRELFIFSLFYLYVLSLSAQNCFQCDSNNASGLKSSAFGKDNIVIGDYSFVAGRNSIASQNYTYIFGYGNSAEYMHSFVFGLSSHALAASTYSIGEYNNTLSNQTMAIGRFITTTYNNTIIIGEGGDADHQLSCNVAHSVAIGCQSKYPTLLVTEPGSNWPDYLNTGRVGIGNVTDPQAKLHMRSDANEAANLFLEPSVWDNNSNAEIWLGNQLHGISAEKNEGLVFKTEHYYLFNQGNMGLGTDKPAAKVHVKSGDIYIEDINHGIIMKSPDGRCWRGTMNDNGQLQFEVLEVCPEDAVISVNDPGSGNGNIRIYPNPAGNYVEIEIKDLKSKSLEFSLIDGAGKEIISRQLVDAKTKVLLGEIAPGVYYGKVSGEGVYYVEKIIKY